MSHNLHLVFDLVLLPWCFSADCFTKPLTLWQLGFSRATIWHQTYQICLALVLLMYHSKQGDFKGNCIPCKNCLTVLLDNTFSALCIIYAIGFLTNVLDQHWTKKNWACNTSWSMLQTLICSNYISQVINERFVFVFWIQYLNLLVVAQSKHSVVVAGEKLILNLIKIDLSTLTLNVSYEYTLFNNYVNCGLIYIYFF